MCSTVACLGVGYVVIMKRMKEVTLFGILVLELLFFSIKSQSAQRKNIINTADLGGDG